MQLHLTKSEKEIMEIFWAENRPLSRSFIMDHAPHKSWRNSSIHILLNSLLEKGVIKIVGFEQTGRRIARTFAPTVDKAEYYTQWITSAENFETIQIPEIIKLLLKDADYETVYASQKAVEEVLQNLQ